MKSILVLALLLVTSFSFGQKIRFKLLNYDKDTTVNLVRYFGKGLYYADTAVIKNGMVEFDGAKQKAGILALYLPDQKLLEFIYNTEEVNIEATYPDLMGSSKIKKSEENLVFHDYVRYMNTKRAQMENYNKQKSTYKPDDLEFKRLDKLIKELNDEVLAKQEEIIQNNPGKLVSKIIRMSMDVVIPESPKDENGKVIDSMFRYNYYHAHYFDNFDFTDDRLVRTPIFHTKLAPYFAKESMFQHCDTILKYAVKLCDRLNEKSETFQYTVSYITSTFEQSKIMNMDKVFVRMVERYYCPMNAEGKPKAFWVPEESLKKICEKANTNSRLVYGSIPANLILKDTSDVEWRDFYSLKSEYTILYFWDPECGHCNKVTPKLQRLYAEKLKARNVEIFAVAKAVDSDFEKWKTKIKQEGYSFINVGVTASMFKDAMDKTDNQRKLMEMLRFTTLESLNYQQTYDVFSTPRVFVLDKDKKIIAKSLSVSQLEDFLDHLQHVKDPVKLFPLEDEDPEEREVH